MGQQHATAQRERLDQALVARGFFETRARAQAAIEAGLVTVGGVVARKASQGVDAGAPITAEAPHPYVSRGGVKLAAALDHFRISPAGRRCLDIGASTGGFTDCLLQRGAAHVAAVDVGSGQLHPKMRADPRILSLEETDIRRVDPLAIGKPACLVVIDVSFIGLREVLPHATRLAAADAQLIALIKPQFETVRSALKKGILRDETLRRDIVDAITSAVAALGWTILGVMPSPIAGGDGNAEFLLAAFRP